MLRMDQVHVIRHKVILEGVSIRAVARQMGVSRNTVRKYLQASEPVRQESQSRRKPVLEKVAPRIDELLEEWRGRTTPKQRITGSRIHRQLIEEGYEVGITTVREYLREKRRQKQEVYIPLVYFPGECAQVDFFEVTVEEAGELRKAWKFLMRLMYSGKDFIWLYDRCDQLSFLDGHVRAFQFFKGVARRIIYDNLTAAVKKRVGLRIELTDRFLALSSHYLFEPCFARPGEGHDKGGVESRGKGIRLQHMTPIPRGETLTEIAESVLEEVEVFSARRVDREGKSVTDRFAEEQKQLLELPDQPFDVREVVLSSVSKQALVRIDTVDYSVPSHWARLPVTVYVGVTDICLSCCGEHVTVDKVRRGKRKVQYRHYLAELARKPQAVRQVIPKLLEELGEPYNRLWKLLVESHGERDAARVMAKVLGAVKDHGQEAVSQALLKALEEGRVDLLALRSSLQEPQGPQQIEVPQSLSTYRIESGRITDYDTLLGGRL